MAKEEIKWETKIPQTSEKKETQHTKTYGLQQKKKKNSSKREVYKYILKEKSQITLYLRELDKRTKHKDSRRKKINFRAEVNEKRLKKNWKDHLNQAAFLKRWAKLINL